MKNNSAQATKVITTHVPMADKIDQMASQAGTLPGLGYQTGAF